MANLGKIVVIIVTCEPQSQVVKNLQQQFKSLFSTHATIHLIVNTYGKDGYATGVNKGIKKSLDEKADLFIVANDDISINNLKKEYFQEAADQFDVWGYAIKQNKEMLYRGVFDKWRMSAGLEKNKPNNRFTTVDFVSGSLMCIKREVVEKIGLWDESYFIYYEDADYCKKATDSGYRVGIDAEHYYKHFEKSDTSNPKKQFLLAKNRLTFLMKFGSFKQKVYEFIRFPKTIVEERKLLVKSITQRPFLRNFISLNASSVINRVFSFFLFLFLIRYLSTDQYGIYSLLWAYVGLVMPFIDFGTTSYGIVRYSDDDTNHFNALVSVRILLSFIAIVLSFFAVIFIKTSLSNFFLMLTIASIVLANGFSGSSLIYFAAKQKSYFTSFISIIFNLFLTASLIVTAVFTHDVNAVFLTMFVFYLFYSVVHGVLLLTVKVKPNFDFSQVKKILRGSLPFVVLMAFSGVYFKADIFLLQFFKGSTTVGIYSAGYKFFEALMFLGASYSLAATPVLSKHLRENDPTFLKKIKRDVPYLCILGFAIAISSYIFAPYVLKLFLPNQYNASIEVFRIVIFALPFILMTNTYFSALHVLKKSYAVILIFIFQLVMNILLNAHFIPIYSYRASAYITVFSEVINIVFAFLAFKFLYENSNRRRGAVLTKN